MHYNSTIRPKMGTCPLCPDDKPKRLLKGMCESHYWSQNKLKSVQKLQNRNIVEEDELQDLKKEADDIFSMFVRLSAADENGYLSCYICGAPVHFKWADCMHFTGRGNHFLRWDIRNCRAGCKPCNQLKDGNMKEFAIKLNQEQLGLPDILLEEGHIPYKHSRHEVRLIIKEYSLKVKSLLKCSS